MFLKRKILVNTLLAFATLSVSSIAVSGIYVDADKNAAFTPDQSGNYFSDGDAYLEGHWWYGHNKTFEIGGSLLEVNNPNGNPKFDQYASNTAIVKGNVNVSNLTIGGQFLVGGTMELNELHVAGQLTDLTGKAVTNQVTVNKGLYISSHDDLVFGNLVAKGEIVVSGGGTLNILGGQLGQKEAAISRLDAQNGSKVFVTGDVYAKNVNAATAEDLLKIDGTLHLSGDNSYGQGTLQVTNLIVGESGGWNQINNLTVKVDQDMVLAGGTLGVQPGTNLSIGNSLTLKGEAFLQYQSADKALKLKKLVLAKDSIKQDGFQTYGAPVLIGVLEVQGAGRIDAYSKNNPTIQSKYTIGEVNVTEGSAFSITHSKNPNDAKATVTIGSMSLGKGASFENGVWKVPQDPSKFRDGADVTINNLVGENATITNHTNKVTIGAGKDSTVIFNGTIDDKKEGVSLTLNNSSLWTVQGKSNVGYLSLEGGYTDISKTDDNLTVNNLNGNGGTIVMDAAKTNTVAVTKTEEKTKVEVKASENADKVTVDQATSMVDRLEGVANKTGYVDEGMYQGAITVNGQGQATQAKNGLMADTLELASASTLSLNRILMNDVRKRLGDIRSAEAVNGVWARYDGGRLSGDGTKNKFNTIHIGGDTMPFAGKPVRVGMSASYTNGDVDYTRGNADMDAYSLAAYGTWLGDNGMFADVIARVAKAESDMTVDSVYKGKLKNTAYSLSGEFGWRFDLNSQFYAEPQVEATYTYIDSDKMTLAGKNETFNYEVEGFDSFIGRMGVLAGMKCPNQKGDVYVRASLVHEFLGDAKINGGANATLENEGKDTWFEYGIGANFNVGKNTYLWADLERTSGALVDEDIRGTLGVRYGF